MGRVLETFAEERRFVLNASMRRTQRGALGKNDGGIRDLEKIRFESISGSDAVYLTDLRARSAQAHDYSSLNANLRGRCNWLTLSADTRSSPQPLL